jgi:hypothetical protein
MNRKPAAAQRVRRVRGRLLGWLLGSGGAGGLPPGAAAAVEQVPSADDAPAPPSLLDEEDSGRAALLGLAAGRADGEEAKIAAPPRDVRPQIPRDMFRVNVSLPANLDVQEQKEVSVRITNISGTGMAFLYDSADPLLPTGNWLDLALPNRPKPLELELLVVRSRLHMGPAGQDQQIVHARFPSIRRNEQDAIIAYINNIRLYESKQFTVAAKVMLEVVTGRRRFAKFNGETIEIRPDMMRLLMDDFDAIVGAEVMLTVMAPKFADHIDVEDVKVEKVEIISPRKAEVEVSLAKPDDSVLLFIRKHYPGVARGRR